MKKVAKLGGEWDNGANAGTFYWNLNNATSNRNRNISRQLVNARNRRGKSKIPACSNRFSVFLNYPAAWRNRQPPQGEVKNKIGLY